MRHGGRRAGCACGVAFALLIAACSNGGHDRAAGGHSRAGTVRRVAKAETPPSTSSVPAGVSAPIAARATPAEDAVAVPHTTGNAIGPIAGGALYKKPRPALRNTGIDYLAVFTSLMEQFRWLTENPDVSIVSQVIAPTSPMDGDLGRLIREMATNRLRSADEGYRLISAKVTDATSFTVELHVTEEFDSEVYLDSNGREIKRIPEQGQVLVRNYALNGNAVDGWRMWSATDAGPIGVIQQ